MNQGEQNSSSGLDISLIHTFVEFTQWFFCVLSTKEKDTELQCLHLFYNAGKSPLDIHKKFGLFFLIRKKIKYENNSYFKKKIVVTETCFLKLWLFCNWCIFQESFHLRFSFCPQNIIKKFFCNMLRKNFHHCYHDQQKVFSNLKENDSKILPPTL